MEFKLNKDKYFQEEKNIKAENELLKDEYKKLVMEYQNLSLTNKILDAEKKSLQKDLKHLIESNKNLENQLEHYKISFIENKARTSVELEYKSARIDELKTKVDAKDESSLQMKFYQYKILELIDSIQADNKYTPRTSSIKPYDNSIDEVRRWVQGLVK
jgi:hypothetical protein